MVVATAAGDRVLLRQAQAGQGLAGVEQLDLGVGHLVGEELRVSRNARQHLQEVQRRALAAEQGTGRAFKVEQHLVGGGAVAILDLPVHRYPWVELAEYRINPGRTGNHAVIAGNDGGLGQALGRDQLGGDVATADVFEQRTAHVGFDFGGQVGEA
ncbi:hypothetical protein D3C81_855870 [compost metagenome]